MKDNLIKLIEQWREDSKMWKNSSLSPVIGKETKERFRGYSAMLASCADELEELIKDSEKQ